MCWWVDRTKMNITPFPFPFIAQRTSHMCILLSKLYWDSMLLELNIHWIHMMLMITFFSYFKLGKLTAAAMWWVAPRSRFCNGLPSSLVLHTLRKLGGKRNTFASYLISFVDSLAIFLGNSLNRIGNNRPERCFIVAFSIFGLIFKTIYTGNLFVTYQQHGDHRIQTINEMNQLNITFYVDGNIFAMFEYLDLCKGKPVWVPPPLNLA